MDKMHIKGLSLMCIIGTKPIERKKKQKIIIDIILECDLRSAGRTDRLGDTVNYNELAEKVKMLVCNSSYFLIERLAEAISKICLKPIMVKGVTVIVEKPAALDMARSASVQIFRRRGKK